MTLCANNRLSLSNTSRSRLENPRLWWYILFIEGVSQPMVSYRRKGRQPLSAGQYFALDRIQSVALDKEHPFKKCVDFDPEHFFDDTIGVTKGIHDKARRVVIKIDRQQAPYVESKPFHKSQKVEQRFRDGSIQLSLKVVINNELERLILGYGGHAEVIAPPEFRARIAESVSIAASHYNRAKE